MYNKYVENFFTIKTLQNWLKFDLLLQEVGSLQATSQLAWS